MLSKSFLLWNCMVVKMSLWICWWRNLLSLVLLRFFRFLRWRAIRSRVRINCLKRLVLIWVNFWWRRRYWWIWRVLCYLMLLRCLVVLVEVCMLLSSRRVSRVRRWSRFGSFKFCLNFLVLLLWWWKIVLLNYWCKLMICLFWIVFLRMVLNC